MRHAVVGAICVLTTICALAPRSLGQEKDGAALRREFDAAVAGALKKRRPETIRALGQGLAGRVGDADIAPLVEQAQGRWENPGQLARSERSVRRRLAIWTLGFIGTEPAVDALTVCALDRKSPYRQESLLALARAPEERARRGLHALVRTDKKDVFAAHIRARAIVLLGALGNRDSLALLSEEQKKPNEAGLARALETRIANLRFKLDELDAEEQKVYAQFELLFWRSVIATPPTRNIEGTYWRAAQAIRTKVKDIPFAFIKRKLDPATAVMEETATATCLCALSKEKRALPSLRQLLKGKAGQTYLRGIALEAIKRINAKP
jgi:hypothetical protein